MKRVPTVMQGKKEVAAVGDMMSFRATKGSPMQTRRNSMGKTIHGEPGTFPHASYHPFRKNI